MTTRHLVHPELRAMLDLIPSRNYSDDTLAAARAQLQGLADAYLPLGNAKVSVESVTFPGMAAGQDVDGLLFRPREPSGPLPAMLQIHGGGYVNGTPELSGPNSQSLAEDLHCAILAVRYRRAPETPFPGPHLDCYAALRFLFEHGTDYGIDVTRIGVSGDSAGGGLAASTCLRARDTGDYAVAFQQLIYPMIDDRTLPEADLNPHVGEFVWTTQNNAYGWRSLIAGAPGGTDVSPYCAPSRAIDLSGLPPTFIGVGSLDLFLEEDLDYARRLARAGVEIELHVYPGAFHGFVVAPTAAPSVAFDRDRRVWLRAQMAPREG